jgi:DNA processing protein
MKIVCAGWHDGYMEEGAMTNGALSRSEGHAETVALLALLRMAPRGVNWGDIAGDVRLAGSAVDVLAKTRESQGLLFPDPNLDRAVAQAEAELSEWDAQGLNLITVLSNSYPARLAGVFDCPPILFTRGAVVRGDAGMSVVGSRKCSQEGEAMARAAAELLIERGLTVIAGLAEGIDTAAHKRALDLGARTVAVIGTGITKYFPAANHALQDEIAAKGLVLSQFYPDQPPTKKTFPVRNATMSGYGMATIVVEAGEQSGSRIQARQAAHHGRPVILSHKVVADTSWGKDMAGDPWVYVAASRRDLAKAVDQILEDSEGNLLSKLGLMPV